MASSGAGYWERTTMYVYPVLAMVGSVVRDGNKIIIIEARNALHLIYALFGDNEQQSCAVVVLIWFTSHSFFFITDHHCKR